MKIVLEETAICQKDGCQATSVDPHKHRHAVVNCNEHKFCKTDTIPPFIEKWSTQLPIMYPFDVHESRKVIARDTEFGGDRHIEKVIQENTDHGYFN